MFGSVAFQNSAGITVSGFLEFLNFYLRSTYIQFEGTPDLQKQGVCIGSCIAPLLSDRLLAHYDRRINANKDVLKVFRCVDDLLVVVNCDPLAIEHVSKVLLALCSEVMSLLDLTHELPVNGQIRFLGIRIGFKGVRVWWCYEPRANKLLLPFKSAHSKLVKRAVVTLCFKNSLEKSCPHCISAASELQTERLLSAGYPQHLLSSVA